MYPEPALLWERKKKKLKINYFALGKEEGGILFGLCLSDQFCCPFLRPSLFLGANDHRCSRAGIASSPSLLADALEDITCLCNNQRSLSLSTQGRARENLMWVPGEIKIKQIYRTRSHEPAEIWEKQGQLRLRQDQTQRRVRSSRCC